MSSKALREHSPRVLASCPSLGVRPFQHEQVLRIGIKGDTEKGIL